ncbi:MAG: hypothetical protein Q8O22_00305 [Candidatus Omnitrophota bacterium]|nr:hypothetical protein [Candidatus Omnitrophota bacterium]
MNKKWAELTKPIKFEWKVDSPNSYWGLILFSFFLGSILSVVAILAWSVNSTEPLETSKNPVVIVLLYSPLLFASLFFLGNAIISFCSGVVYTFGRCGRIIKRHESPFQYWFFSLAYLFVGIYIIITAFKWKPLGL